MNPFVLLLALVLGTGPVAAAVPPADVYVIKPRNSLEGDGNGALAMSAGILYFTDGSAPAEQRAALWRSDGTPEGTFPLDSQVHGNAQVTAIAPFGDGVVFRAGGENFSPARYYRTDAALAAAAALTPVLERSSEQLLSDGGDVYFFCSEQQSPGNPHEAGDLCRIGADSAFGVLYSPMLSVETFIPIGKLGGVSVFTDGVGSNVWRSDGTAPGTFVLTQILYQTFHGGAGIPAAVLGDKLHFNACVDEVGPCGLFSTDGTVAGTAMYWQRSYMNVETGMEVVDGHIVFAFRGDGNLNLWSTDGTTSGTVELHVAMNAWVNVVSRPTVTGRTAHFFFDCIEACAERYVVTDGTPAGTRVKQVPADIQPRTQFAALDDHHVLFVCGTPAAGNELCIADSDGNNIALWADVNPGSAHSYPGYVARRNDEVIFFMAYQDVDGLVLMGIRVPRDAIFADGFD